VKAVGKTWHKGCLKCLECNTSLATGNLTEKDGDPLCHRCYGKVRAILPRPLEARLNWLALQLHGPQGSGYALLGKAGG
jgi:hypothetical protein